MIGLKRIAGASLIALSLCLAANEALADNIVLSAYSGIFQEK